MKAAKQARRAIVEVAEKLLLARHGNSEVVHHLAREFSLTAIDAWGAVMEAWQRWEGKCSVSFDARKARHLDTLGAVFREAMAAKAYSAAVRTLVEIADIEGFHTATKLEIAQLERPPTAQERRERLERRLAEQGLRLLPAAPLVLPSSAGGNGTNGTGGNGVH